MGDDGGRGQQAPWIPPGFEGLGPGWGPRITCVRHSPILVPSARLGIVTSQSQKPIAKLPFVCNKQPHNTPPPQHHNTLFHRFHRAANLLRLPIPSIHQPRSKQASTSKHRTNPSPPTACVCPQPNLQTSQPSIPNLPTPLPVSYAEVASKGPKQSPEEVSHPITTSPPSLHPLSPPN